MLTLRSHAGPNRIVRLPGGGTVQMIRPIRAGTPPEIARPRYAADCDKPVIALACRAPVNLGWVGHPLSLYEGNVQESFRNGPHIAKGFEGPVRRNLREARAPPDPPPPPLELLAGLEDMKPRFLEAIMQSELLGQSRPQHTEAPRPTLQLSTLSNRPWGGD